MIFLNGSCLSVHHFHYTLAIILVQKEGRHTMITENSLKQMVRPERYAAGLRLLSNRNTKITYDVDADDYPSVTFTVYFSRYGSEVETSCVINEKTGNINVRCDCMEFLIYRGQCAHTIAALIFYIRERDAGKLGLPDIHSTTDSLMQFMDSSMEPENTGKGDIFLEPHLIITDSDSMTATFKIGRKGLRAYQLKSVNDLMNAMEEHRTISYGKNLSFIPEISSFMPSWQPMVRFLQRLGKAAEGGGGYYYDATSTYNGGFYKELTLSSIWVDEFMDALQDNPVILNSGGETSMKVVREPQKLSFSIKPDKYGMEMTMPSLMHVNGSKAVWFFRRQDNVIFPISLADDQSRRFLSLLEHVEEERVHIDEKDLKKFTQTVYPLLAEHGEVKTEGYLPEKYMPPKAVFEVYLDLPQADIINGALYSVYGDRKYNLYDPKDENKELDQRNEAVEKHMVSYFSSLFNSFSQADSRMVLQGSDDDLYKFLTQSIPDIQKKAKIYISDALKKLTVHSMGTFSFGVSVNHDLLQLHLNTDQRTLDDLAEIMSRYSPKKRYYRLKNGSFVTVDDAMAENMAKMANDLNVSAKDIRKGEFSLPKYRAMYLDESAEDADILMDRDEYFTKLVHNVKHIEDADYDIPESLKDILRPYQKDGYRWLRTLQENGFGALLADEMGLGKSLQTIALIQSLPKRERCLIVCPASLVYNWNNEFQKFSPGIHVCMITGSASEREERILTSGRQDVLVTSYDAIKRDIDAYKNMHFTVQVIDEAQYIKNAATLAAQAVKEINAGFRIALTGTPIENRLSELWSIFDYLMPGFLYGYTHFKQTFETPIVKSQDKDAQARLRAMIAPFILRRRKQDVLKDLPPKLEEVYFAPLEGEQKELYEARVQRLKIMLAQQSDDQFRQARFEVLAELTRLRQICCDPSLIYDDYKGNSAKKELCLELIQRAVQEGHKVLLFSSFTSMLYELSRRLKEAGIEYYLLEGKTSKENIQKLVNAFQDDFTPVFLISLKAGGTGLNLTAADIVIHYDPWWNTAVEDQASDRAHRIGQDKPVSVYRLITKETVEERILKLQEGKNKLADNILSGDELASSAISRQQLLDIL